VLPLWFKINYEALKSFMKKHLIKAGLILSGGLWLAMALGAVAAQGQVPDEAPRERLHALTLDTTHPLTETRAMLNGLDAVA
jgi:hypothetical protein